MGQRHAPGESEPCRRSDRRTALGNRRVRSTMPDVRMGYHHRQRRQQGVDEDLLSLRLCAATWRDKVRQSGKRPNQRTFCLHRPAEVFLKTGHSPRRHLRPQWSITLVWRAVFSERKRGHPVDIAPFSRMATLDSQRGKAMTTRRLVFTVIFLAGLLLANPALAVTCTTCVRVCVDKANGGQKCTTDCSPTLCPGNGSSVVIDRAHTANFLVKEGSVCTLKIRSASSTKISHGIVRANTCALQHPVR
jgi:hypothetical protein